ncbi:MAG: nicotinamide mononucleotide transporter [Ruminococcaceae bacterium]|nr:nicotinamide mononucleotide transporter [Oscillospiraceae bacterium]
MNFKTFVKKNAVSLCLMIITAALITVTGVVYHQRVIRILPLYISLVIGLLQSRASRFAPLLGGFNSILYMIVYLNLGLYASAGYALLFSFPIQIITFVRWSRQKYKDSTQFRAMTCRQRIATAVISGVAIAVLCLILDWIGSNYSVLDSLSSLLGILVSILTMLAFIEYTWLMLPSGLIGIALNFATMQDHPEQITYLIFAIYSLICVTIGFFRVRKLYAEQTATHQE